MASMRLSFLAALMVLPKCVIMVQNSIDVWLSMLPIFLCADPFLSIVCLKQFRISF
jgi:hypothetical protein